MFEAAPAIENCSFVGNDARHIGGGVAAQSGGSIALANCIFIGNTSDQHGGGMRSAFNTVSTLRHCTFALNTAGEDGGGFSTNRDDAAEGSIDLYNCILWGNDAPSGTQISVEGDTNDYLSVYDSDVQDSSGGDTSGIDGNVTFYGLHLNVDPLFVNSGGGDLRLQYESPCINNGDGSEVGTDIADFDGDSNTAERLAWDADGSPRQVNPSYDVSTNCVDMGAYENQVEGTCPGDVTGPGGVPDGVVDVDDLFYVINLWDTPGGAADMYPSPCGDGNVDDDDLDIVTNNWGDCPGSFAPSSGPPQWWLDCLESCGGDVECLLECIQEAIEE